MLDYAGTQNDHQQDTPVGGLDAITAELRQLGFVPPHRFGHTQTAICGTSLRVSVSSVLRADQCAESFLRRLCHIVDEDLPVCLSPEDFDREAPVLDVWQRFCEIIRSALSWRGHSSHHVGLCMQSHQMPLHDYCRIADSVLGNGPRYVFLDSLQLATHCDARVVERAEASWAFLWRQRATERPVMPVYGGVVRSTCPLLAEEVASLVLPRSGLHVPVDSAWLPVGLPLTRFADTQGQIDWNVLSPALRRAVDLAEEMLDQVTWHLPKQRDDAIANRRLAFSVTGLGDLALRGRHDPTDLHSLNELADVVKRVRSELYGRSGTIAAETAAIPALVQANPVSEWSAGAHRDAWRRHWEIAVRKSAVRHRNMLVLSPYSVLPAGAESSANFADLLPLIALADAWNFSCPAKFSEWDLMAYKHFHRRARAIIQGSHSASFVAAGV